MKALTHASDVPVESDVVESELRRRDLSRVLHAGVALREDVLMSERRVVVEHDLRVDAPDLAVTRVSQRVDLHLDSLLLDEQLVKTLHLRLSLLDLSALESERLRDLQRIGVLDSLVDVDRLRDDLLWGRVGHFLERETKQRRASRSVCFSHVNKELLLAVACREPRCPYHRRRMRR